MTRPQLNPTIQRIAFLIATPIVITAGAIVGTGIAIVIVAIGNLLLGI